MSFIGDILRQYRESGVTGVLSGAYRFAKFRMRRYLNILGSKPFDWRSPAACDVMTEDWDILILLDACRHDYFARVHDLRGKLEARTSVAGSSKTFIQESFVGRELHDTVYVTGNPYVKEVPTGTFHAVHDEPLHEGFDSERGTIPPEVITDAALRADERYPEKRLIIHYMQPHMPPLGPTADRLDEKFGLGGIEMGRDAPQPGLSVYELARKGKIDREVARECYKETLEIVLDDVKELLVNLDGRVVISADHGEYLGERVPPLYRPRFGHGPVGKKPRKAPLYRVPWFVVSGNTRRTISSDPPTSKQPEKKSTTDQLEALGYL